MPFISVCGRRRSILAESRDPTQALRVPIDVLMMSSSFADADQVLYFGKPLKGGGPLCSSESTYRGAGFLVDRVGRFEYPAPAVSTGCGGVVLFTFCWRVFLAASDPVSVRLSLGAVVSKLVEVGSGGVTTGKSLMTLDGLPLTGIVASLKSARSFAGLALAQ